MWVAASLRRVAEALVSSLIPQRRTAATTASRPWSMRSSSSTSDLSSSTGAFLSPSAVCVHASALMLWHNRLQSCCSDVDHRHQLILCGSIAAAFARKSELWLMCVCKAVAFLSKVQSVAYSERHCLLNEYACCCVPVHTLQPPHEQLPMTH